MAWKIVNSINHSKVKFYFLFVEKLLQLLLPLFSLAFDLVRKWIKLFANDTGQHHQNRTAQSVKNRKSFPSLPAFLFHDFIFTISFASDDPFDIVVASRRCCLYLHKVFLLLAFRLPLFAGHLNKILLLSPDIWGHVNVGGCKYLSVYGVFAATIDIFAFFSSLDWLLYSDF